VDIARPGPQEQADREREQADDQGEEAGRV